MNYNALNAKVQAMRSHERFHFEPQAIPDIHSSPVEAACESLLKYIFDKSMKDFVREFGSGLASGETGVQYYLSLWRKLNKMDKLGSMNRKPGINSMKQSLGLDIDLRNVLWIYRLRKYHNIQGHAVYGHLIPVRHRFSKADIANMVNCRNIDEIMRPYRQAAGLAGARFDSPEKYFATLVCQKYNSEFRKNANSLTGACGYLYALHMKKS